MKNTDKNTPIPQSCKTAVMQSVIIEELLQKIKFVLSCENDAQAERIIEQFFFHQQELTIEFSEWLRNECYDTGDKWLYQEDDETYTSLEIYEIFNRKRSETVA